MDTAAGYYKGHQCGTRWVPQVRFVPSGRGGCGRLLRGRTTACGSVLGAKGGRGAGDPRRNDSPSTGGGPAPPKDGGRCPGGTPFPSAPRGPAAEAGPGREDGGARVALGYCALPAAGFGAARRPPATGAGRRPAERSVPRREGARRPLRQALSAAGPRESERQAAGAPRREVQRGATAGAGASLPAAPRVSPLSEGGGPGRGEGACRGGVGGSRRDAHRARRAGVPRPCPRVHRPGRAGAARPTTQPRRGLASPGGAAGSWRRESAAVPWSGGGSVSGPATSRVNGTAFP